MGYNTPFAFRKKGSKPNISHIHIGYKPVNQKGIKKKSKRYRLYRFIQRLIFINMTSELIYKFQKYLTEAAEATEKKTTKEVDEMKLKDRIIKILNYLIILILTNF